VKPVSVAEQADARTGERGPVGAQLARARIAHGLSIDDLYRRTNVRPIVISALERDDVRPSGGVVYARGHLRTLGQALGLDVTPLLAAFDASHGTTSAPVLIPDTDAAEVSLRSSGPSTTGPRWPLALAAVLVVVIVVALVQLVLPGKDKGNPVHIRAASPVVSSSAKPKTVAPKPSAQPPSLTFPVPAQGVTLRIILASKPSWLAAMDERGVQLLQRVVQPSDQPLDLHAAGQLNVTIGDASAAALSCNGHPLGPLGGPGQVVSLSLLRGTIQCPAG
jgi:cytoskeleton protein RodZ